MSDVTFDLMETVGRLGKKPNFGWNVIAMDTIDSTQAYAKANAYEHFQVPTLVVAKHQTEGRGRGTNTWVDDGEGRSFLSTWTIELNEGPADPRWTLGVGLYLFESLSEAFKSVRFSMKAPNDICIGDKKVAGLLLEGTSQGDVHFLHVGLGMNVFSYPAECAQTATHLNAYLGATSLNAETWTQFLEYFGRSLMNIETRAKAVSTDGWLPKISRRLCEALNRHPMYAENPIKSVKADGTLLREQGTIPWQQI